MFTTKLKHSQKNKKNIYLYFLISLNKSYILQSSPDLLFMQFPLSDTLKPYPFICFGFSFCFQGLIVGDFFFFLSFCCC